MPLPFVRSMLTRPNEGAVTSYVTVRAVPSVCTMLTASLKTGTPPLSPPAAETTLQLLLTFQLPLTMPFFQNLVAWATVAGASTTLTVMTAAKGKRRPTRRSFVMAGSSLEIRCCKISLAETPSGSRKHRNAAEEHRDRSGRFGHGRSTGRASGTRAAAGHVAEVGAPGVELERADRAAVGIVGERGRRAGVFAPHDVVGGVDFAVVVVVAGEAGASYAQHAGGVELRSVPAQAGEGGQLQRVECATRGAPIEEIERLAGRGCETVDERQLEGAVEGKRAGGSNLVVSAAGRMPPSSMTSVLVGEKVRLPTVAIVGDRPGE